MRWDIETGILRYTLVAFKWLATVRLFKIVNMRLMPFGRSIFTKVPDSGIGVVRANIIAIVDARARTWTTEDRGENRLSDRER